MTWRKTWLWSSRLAAAIVFFFVCNTAFAQKTAPKNVNDQTASLHGNISTAPGNSEGGLAGITVKLSRVPADGPPLSAETDENGRYEFSGLRPGTYTISVGAPGFKAIAKSVTLGARQQSVQDFTLQLETVSEKVEVNATAAAITTESSSVPPATVTNSAVAKAIPPIEFRRGMGVSSVDQSRPIVTCRR